MPLLLQLTVLQLAYHLGLFFLDISSLQSFKKQQPPTHSKLSIHASLAQLLFKSERIVKLLSDLEPSALLEKPKEMKDFTALGKKEIHFVI